MIRRGRPQRPLASFYLPCFNEDASCEYRGQRQLACAHSQKAHLGVHFSCSAEVIDSTKRLYSSEAPRDSFGSRRCGHRGTWKNHSLASFERPIYQGIPAPLSLSPALLSSLVQVLPKYSSLTCFVARVRHRASTSFEVWLDLEALPSSS